MSSPFEVARAISNNLGKLQTNISDRSAIDEILSKQYSGADPAAMQRDIASILNRVSPDRQQAVIGAVKANYEQGAKSEQLSQRKATAKAYGLPESIAYMPDSTFNQALKGKMVGDSPTYDEYKTGTPEERAALHAKNPKVAASYKGELTRESKPTPPTPFEKKLGNDAAEDFKEQKKIYTEADKSLYMLDQMESLEKKFKGITGYTGAKIGVNPDAAQFNVISLGQMKQALDIINPRGQIPLGKINLVRDEYTAKATDTSEVIRSKIEGSRILAKYGKEVAAKKMELYEKYNGPIPISEMLRIDNELAKEGESIIDGLLEKAGINPNMDNIRVSVNGVTGTIPADKYEDFKKKNPNVEILE